MKIVLAPLLRVRGIAIIGAKRSVVFRGWLAGGNLRCFGTLIVRTDLLGWPPTGRITLRMRGLPGGAASPGTWKHAGGPWPPSPAACAPSRGSTGTQSKRTCSITPRPRTFAGDLANEGIRIGGDRLADCQGAALWSIDPGLAGYRSRF